MVRENRIKTYRFTAGSLAAPATGRFDIYTAYPLNGTVQKISFLGGNYTATGSFLVTISGTQETILNFTSGTTQGNVAAKSHVYTHVFTHNENGVTGSPTIATQRVIGGEIVRVTASGLGNGTSGLGLEISYI